MDERGIRIEVTNGVATVTIDRQEALNALNTEIVDGLHRVFHALGKDESVRAVILTGAGKAFVAGADIKEMADFTPVQARAFSRRGQRVLSEIEAFPRPVIAAVNGFALGGGCELAMACDVRIASEKARFGQPEVSLGVTPGFGGTQRLARLVGRSKAKLLLFTGEVIGAERALALGLVDEVVAPEALMDRCRDIASAIAGKGPVAVSYCKQAVNVGVETDLEHALAYEAELFAQTFATADQKEGMQAFVEKRPVRFSGR
ncbi:MAG TPA: enoyl-CoA hydratase-related protein [Thermoanaerobaculaceae bacterium]|nr:enoyl-CoA hydratase-related protein [Thermoanaerobaculaceae bacterium]HRS17668.1 enoyl-CoA hydratase-related protein [Thermoanaerobaculaceae bacterium]